MEPSVQGRVDLAATEPLLAGLVVARGRVEF